MSVDMQLRKRVSKGIPNGARPEAWKHLLEVDKHRKAGIYEVHDDSWERVTCT